MYLTEQNLGRVMCRIIKKKQDKSQFFDNKSGDFLVFKQSIQLGRKKMLCKETKIVLRICWSLSCGLCSHISWFFPAKICIVFIISAFCFCLQSLLKLYKKNPRKVKKYIIYKNTFHWEEGSAPSLNMQCFQL